MTETQTVDLAAWLTRIWDEEERLAKECIAEVGGHRAGEDFPDGSGVADYDAFPSYPWGSVRYELAYMAGPGHPASVLARIAADRKILAAWEYESNFDYAMGDGGTDDGLLFALRCTASAYSDRPGWRKEWDPRDCRHCKPHKERHAYNVYCRESES